MTELMNLLPTCITFGLVRKQYLIVVYGITEGKTIVALIIHVKDITVVLTEK